MIKKIILFLLLLLLIYIQNVSAAILFVNQIPDGVRPIQITLNVSNASGISNSTQIYCNGKCGINFSDIYFSQNGVNLSHWIEDNSTGRMWINVTGNGNVLMNNSSSINMSNGTTTFPFYSESLIGSGGGSTSPLFGTNHTIRGKIMFTANNQQWGFGTNTGNPRATLISATGILKYLATPTGDTQQAIGETIAINAPIRVFDIIRNGTTNVRVRTNDRNETTYADDGSIDVGIKAETFGTFTFYWSFVANYTYPEVVWNTWTNLTTTPSIQSISTTTFNFGVNTSWICTTVATCDSYNVNVNGTWNNGTTQNYLNITTTPHGYSNITVFAHNSTGSGNYSTSVNLNTTVPNNVPTIPSITNPLNNSYQYNNSVNISYSSTDADGDIINYTISISNDNLFSVNLTTSNTTNITKLLSTIDNFSYYIMMFATDNFSGNSTNTLPINFREAWHPMQLLSPANGSTTSINPTLIAGDFPNDPPYLFQVATDSGFLHIVSSGSGTVLNDNISFGISLLPGATYYWRVTNNSGLYTDYSIFSTVSTAIVPGSLNITVFDEQNISNRILQFSATAYNNTAAITKNTLNGYVNFSSSEVVSGQYLIAVNNFTNATYSQRMQLVTSPNTLLNMYVPNSSTNTIDVISFYLLDYTNKFPFTSSYIQVVKGNLTMHSAFFDADAKIAVNLIRGVPYTIIVNNFPTSATQQWGNYISTGSGNVEVVVMNLGFNSSQHTPYIQSVYANNTVIIVNWNDSMNVLTGLDVSIYKDNTTNVVYSLHTTIPLGSVSYILSANGTYYTKVNASTTLGVKQDTNINVVGSTDRLINHWIYGSYATPDWMRNIFGIMIIFMIGGSFGAMHRGEGAIISAIMTMTLWYYKILTLTSGVLALVGGLVILSILYHLESRRRGG